MLASLPRGLRRVVRLLLPAVAGASLSAPPANARRWLLSTGAVVIVAALGLFVVWQGSSPASSSQWPCT